MFVTHGQVLTESMVICQFLDEEYAQCPLMPESPLGRAQARLAIETCNFKFMPKFYAALTLSETPPSVTEQLVAVLREIEAQLREASQDGPFWFGAQFTLVDIAYFPFLDRSVVHPITIVQH